MVADTLADLERTTRRLVRAERKLKLEQGIRNEQVTQAAREGAGLPLIARVAGLSHERVRQLVEGKK